MQKQRQEKKEITRQKILTASYELFNENGYDETSYADIAARAEIGYGTVYAHFPTKEDMLHAQMHMLMQMQEVSLIEQSQEDRTDLEHVFYLIDHAWRIIHSLNPRLLSVYMAYRWDVKRTEYYQDNVLRDSMLDIIKTHLLRAQAAGDLSPALDISKHMFIMDACYIKSIQVGRFSEADHKAAKADFDKQVRYLLRLD